MLSFREFHDELLDEGGDVVVGYHFTFPLLDAERRVGDLDLHVFLDLDLASEPPVFAYLLPVEETYFGRQDCPAAFKYLAFALSAASFTAAG